ncbi:LOW QUALITY PROTEIN: tropomodulin-4-like [Narcine bancroftii]|uniref:LOW QUALITY PROTEIN: tropomodulin-4-like n=1 Tax=Narcine bancroftii TaxID=1343680 RepID=UPI00383176A7
MQQQHRDKYLNIDEDQILGELSENQFVTELDLELMEMDPENALLPAGLRQRDQTKKTPTGPYDRDQLLDYLEKEALNVEERADLVPFTGEKRGKPFVPKQRELTQFEKDAAVILEPELEEALANASDAEMCDIAAILGMYKLMSNKQYYDALGSGVIMNTEGINSVVKPDSYEYKPVPDEPPNETDVEDTLRRIKNNDKNLVEVNLNNIQDIPISMLKELADTMKQNQHVQVVSLVATRSNDPVAHALAGMLEVNTSLRSLNIESNFITGAGMVAIAKAMRQNRTVTELKIDNQRHQLGDAAEMEIASMLEQNTNIVRFGYHFSQQGPRARAAIAITKNNDLGECTTPISEHFCPVLPSQLRGPCSRVGPGGCFRTEAWSFPHPPIPTQSCDEREGRVI